MAKKRIYAYDVLRIMAALAVVMVHVAAPYIKTASVGSGDFLWGTFFGATARMGVQLFVMISGALMLNENKEYTFRSMGKSIGGMLAVLLFWSLFYATLHPLAFGKTLTWELIWQRLVAGHYHLWYLFMVIGLHLITPILRVFTKKENERYVLYYIGLAAVFQFTVPILKFLYAELGGTDEVILNYADKFKIGILGEYTAYYLLGWYLTNVEISKKARRMIYALGCVGFAVIFGASLYFSNDGFRAYTVFYQNHTVQVMFFSTGVFLFVYERLRDWEPSASKKVLTKLSALTFGVYVIHVFLLDVLRLRFPMLIDFGPTPLRILWTWLLILVTSFLVSCLISLIPFVKKTVRC